jgi:hypothetical protein
LAAAHFFVSRAVEPASDRYFPYTEKYAVGLMHGADMQA